MHVNSKYQILLSWVEWVEKFVLIDGFSVLSRVWSYEKWFSCRKGKKKKTGLEDLWLSELTKITIYIYKIDKWNILHKKHEQFLVQYCLFSEDKLRKRIQRKLEKNWCWALKKPVVIVIEACEAIDGRKITIVFLPWVIQKHTHTSHELFESKFDTL